MPEPLRYTNRMGVDYFLQGGTTPSGKPKVYTGRKLTGTPLAALPEGYEFYERPDTAQVLVRKIKPSRLLPIERQRAEAIVRRKSGLAHVILEVEGDRLVIYTPMLSTAEADRLIRDLGGVPMARSSRAEELRDDLIRRSQFHPMLRLTLIDPETRTFRAARWCFRGAIDGWIGLGLDGPLDTLLERLAPHLDRESFYDLI